MRLTDLKASFIKFQDHHLVYVNSLEEAQGIIFLCPNHFKENNGPIGTHSIICCFQNKGVPDDVLPGIHRWPATGKDLEDLTLNPSVDAGCFHGWIINGNIS